MLHAPLLEAPYDEPPNLDLAVMELANRLGVFRRTILHANNAE